MMLILDLSNVHFQSKPVVGTTFMTGKKSGKEGNVLFNDALNTFYIRLYGVRHMVKKPLR